MRSTLRPAALLLVALLSAGCAAGAGQSPSASVAASASTSAAASVGASSSAAASASAAPSVAESAPASGSGVAAACASGSLQTVTPGTVTIGTDNPAYPPYFDPPAEGETATDPWELGDPTNGRGFESAVAYAIADELAFGKDQVEWTYVPFSNSFAPGRKEFDFDINQISFTAERAQSVDMSEGYYFLNQALVATEGSPIASAKSIAELREYRLGAQVGTTSLGYITDEIGPSQEASVYDTNDAAIAALNAGQIDGIVVDLPTAFFITAAQMENGVIVGQFPAGEGEQEHFSVVLEKGSPLTDCVNQAIASLQASGELESITQEWLSDKANAPEFTP